MLLLDDDISAYRERFAEIESGFDNRSFDKNKQLLDSLKGKVDYIAKAARKDWLDTWDVKYRERSNAFRELKSDIRFSKIELAKNLI